MSSFRQNSRIKKQSAAVCPVCGESALATTRESFAMTVNQHTYRVTGVKHEKCSACGELLFDYNASHALDELVLGRRRNAA